MAPLAGMLHTRLLLSCCLVAGSLLGRLPQATCAAAWHLHWQAANPSC